jgi:hypothetical protein
MKPKVIALYLPQYHPIPENDQWWGKGFTEWTNVAQARPLFKGHYQPRIPADLGFYDLRLKEIREQQVELAREHGVSGFCYYHYWFGNGKQLLENPFNEVLQSGKPDFPFMLCWANETWKGVWFGASKGKILIEQTYPGKEDYIQHFSYLVKAFADPRYITIDEKPVFQVYRISDIPDLKLFVDVFRDQAKKAGLKGIYLLAGNVGKNWDPKVYDFDGVICNNFHKVRVDVKNNVFKNKTSLFSRIEQSLMNIVNSNDPEKREKPIVIDYNKMNDLVTSWPNVNYDYFPQIVPNWDNSARTGTKSLIIKGSTPELWSKQVYKAIDYVRRYNGDKKIIFVKSWNEWAEGNYLEPDQKWGKAYLEKLKETIK